MLRSQIRTEVDRLRFKRREGQICVTMIPARWQTMRRHQVHRAQVTRRRKEENSIAGKVDVARPRHSIASQAGWRC